MLFRKGKSSADKQVDEFKSVYQNDGHTRKYNGRGVAVRGH